MLLRAGCENAQRMRVLFSVNSIEFSLPNAYDGGHAYVLRTAGCSVYVSAGDGLDLMFVYVLSMKQCEP